MEARYDEMNQRNLWSNTPPRVNPTLEGGRCSAVYALGDWHLHPSFERLCRRLRTLLGSTACFYSPVPSASEGLLHQTLLQFVKFDAEPSSKEAQVEGMTLVAHTVAEAGLAPWITYKGLVWTPTGLALAGYCVEEQAIQQLREKIETTLKEQALPCEIPYRYDILHVTVMRWVQQPSEEQLKALEKELLRWSECTLGELRVREWRVGFASYRMREEEREDYFSVPVQQHICHRGILNTSAKELENNFGVLIQREIQGLAVEVDVWYAEKSLWLGHDKPEYRITLEWLAASRRRLIHAKDGATFAYLLEEAGKRALDLHVFYHTDEDYVLTNKGLVICYPGQPLLPGSLCMMPERASYSPEQLVNAYAICSDLYSSAEKKDG